MAVHGQRQQTATEDLNYECRLYEVDLVEEPEIIAPWDPIPPELQWVGCTSPWESELVGEEGSCASRCGPSTATTTSTRRPPTRHPAERAAARDDHRGEAAAGHEQPLRHVHVLGRRPDHAAAVHGVRVPPRHEGSRAVARVLQPDHLQQPGERRAHDRGARGRRRRRARRPDPGPLLVDRRPGAAATATPRTSRSPRSPTAGSTRSTRSRTTSSRPSSSVASGATFDPTRRRRPADRRERALALPLRAAHRRGALHARVGDAAPLQRQPRGGPHPHWPRRSRAR